MRAESAGPGQGAEFTFWVPLDAEQAALTAAPADAPTAGRPLRVVIVEDNRDAAETLRVLLEMAGHQVAVAHTGAAGLEAVHRLGADVVLCDLGLPGLDGYAVARALRRDAATAGTRLIAVTGYGTEEDRRQCLEAGYDLHLTKPVEPESLYALLHPTPAPPEASP